MSGKEATNQESEQFPRIDPWHDERREEKSGRQAQRKWWRTTSRVEACYVGEWVCTNINFYCLACIHRCVCILSTYVLWRCVECKWLSTFHMSGSKCSSSRWNIWVYIESRKSVWLFASRKKACVTMPDSVVENNRSYVYVDVCIWLSNVATVCLRM